jgi:hypothetical protein
MEKERMKMRKIRRRRTKRQEAEGNDVVETLIRCSFCCICM